MDNLKPVKNSAYVSQYLIILWAALTVLSLVLQDSFVYGVENTEPVIVVSVIAQAVSGILIIVTNLLLVKNKFGVFPLVLSSVSTALIPVATFTSDYVQAKFVAIKGADYLARFSQVKMTASLILYVLYAAAVITIAASAVFAYTKRNIKE